LKRTRNAATASKPRENPEKGIRLRRSGGRDSKGGDIATATHPSGRLPPAAADNWKNYAKSCRLICQTGFQHHIHRFRTRNRECIKILFAWNLSQSGFSKAVANPGSQAILGAQFCCTLLPQLSPMHHQPLSPGLPPAAAGTASLSHAEVRAGYEWPSDDEFTSADVGNLLKSNLLSFRPPRPNAASL